MVVSVIKTHTPKKINKALMMKTSHDHKTDATHEQSRNVKQPEIVSV